MRPTLYLEDRRAALMLDYQRVLGHLEEIDYLIAQFDAPSDEADQDNPEPQAEEPQE
jgi:hypothetical protein